MKDLKITIFGLLRRFATAGATALIVYISGHWTDWLIAAAKGDVKSAAWLPVIYLAIEFIQKFTRTRSATKKAELFGLLPLLLCFGLMLSAAPRVLADDASTTTAPQSSSTTVDNSGAFSKALDGLIVLAFSDAQLQAAYIVSLSDFDQQGELLKSSKQFGSWRLGDVPIKFTFDLFAVNGVDDGDDGAGYGVSAQIRAFGLFDVGLSKNEGYSGVCLNVVPISVSF